MFLSTFEKQLDSKRRIVVPQDYRAMVATPFDGVYCFQSLEADCLEAGGQPLFERYRAVMEELPFGDPLRSALEVSVLGGMTKLAFDAGGRITLPDALCELAGITEWVTVVGMGDRFQIWSKEAFQAHRASAREAARDGLATMRLRQRGANAA